MMGEKITLGRFIALRRNHMGLTQEELAEKIGVSKSAIAKWETDGGIPDRDNLKRLSEKMHVSVDELHRIINREAPDANVKSLLIIDATTGQNAVLQTEAFAEAVDLDYVGITKLDGSAKGGVAISVAYTAKVPIVLAGLGEGVDDLMDFDPEAFVDSLLAKD